MKMNRFSSTVLYVLSVIIPVIIIVTALVGLKITPFGDNSLAISDGNGLYLNYLGYVGRALRGKESVLFSFTKGLGANMMGSWGWFLLNPFFVLFAFTDITNYMATYTIVSILNFAICGLTMYILLKDIYGHKLSNLIFSTAYALNGFLVANVFQMNFFACIPVLPLMVMGLRRILKNGNPLIYILSVAYSLMMNFYFGFMICVASILIFIVIFIAYHQQVLNRKLVAVKYIISSFLAGVLSSFVWIPALLSLRGGRLDQNVSYFITLRENMPFLDMFAKLFTGANTTTELQSGLPNIYIGILPVFLLILFFMDKKIPRQRKVIAAILLVMYLLSFYIAVFNLVMHGGTTTNWFNYRNSFVFAFLMLMVAVEEWQHIIDEPGANIKKAAILFLIGTIIVFSKSYEFVTGTAVLIDIAILALMFFAYWMYKRDPKKNTKRTFTVVVLVLMCLNLFLNYYICTKNIMDWTHTESAYQNTVIPVSALVDATHNSDPSFYRMEIGEQRSGNCGNDPMLYGYYGVGHGGSDDRDSVRLALSEIGVHRYNMRNYYGKGMNSATDAFLGLKYIISKEDLVMEKGYERLVGIDEWGLYRNNNALPIAFVSNEDTDDVELGLEDIFENLNSVWSAITGIDDKIFVEEHDIVFSSHNATDPMTISGKDASAIANTSDVSIETTLINNQQDRDLSPSLDGNSKSTSTDPDFITEGTLSEITDNSNYIEYTFTAPMDGTYYSYNGSGMTESNGAIPPALSYEGHYHKGDVVTRYLPILGGGFATEPVVKDVAAKFSIACVQQDVLEEMSRAILSRPSTIERITDGYLHGTFTAKEGQELLFTIPYDEGWTMYVDGMKTDYKQVLGVFMAADVVQGEHTWELRFIPAGFMMGAVASSVALIVLIFYIWIDFRKRKRGFNAERFG